MNATLCRFKFLNICTFGFLYTDESKYYTLELPWRDNERNNSCIPVGEYECEFMPSSSSGKYKSVYHVKGVEGRDGILIHNGNLPEHTKGCVLLGSKIGPLGGRAAVLGSRTAMKRFVREMEEKNFKLKVLEWAI